MVMQTPDGAVEFKFYRPDAMSASLAGDFNDWQRGSFPMKKDGEGWWRCRLTVAPGEYEFRYFIDGQWYTDYAAFGVTPTAHGWNSVLNVEPAKIKLPSLKVQVPEEQKVAPINNEQPKPKRTAKSHSGSFGRIRVLTSQKRKVKAVA